MPTRNINLTPQMDRFVDTKIQSGQYANASEVFRAGLRALQQDEKEDKARLEALRTAIEDGIKSGPAEGDPIRRLRTRIQRRVAATRKLSA